MLNFEVENKNIITTLIVVFLGYKKLTPFDYNRVSSNEMDKIIIYKSYKPKHNKESTLKHTMREG